MKRIFQLLLTTAIFAISINVSAATKSATINFATWLSPTHPHNADVLKTWGGWVEEATEGRVKVNVENYVGHPKDLFDLVEDGSYQGSWSYHGYVPGRFKLTKVVELPGLGAGAEAASAAHWNVNEKYLAKAGEHDGLKLIGLFTHGPGQIMMREPISNLADMKGKKIRVGGGIQGDIAKLLGVTAVPAPGSKVYEILQTGVADGVFMPVGEQNTLKLSDVAKVIYQLPGGMYLGSFGIFLNPEFFDSLSAKDQKAIMSVSGEKLSAYAGKVWDKNDATGYSAAKSAGNKVVKAPQAEADKFNKMVSGIEASWLKEIASAGVDGKAALMELRKSAKSY